MMVRMGGGAVYSTTNDTAPAAFFATRFPADGVCCCAMRIPMSAVVFDLGQTLWHYDDQRPAEDVYEMQARCVEPLLERWGVRLDSPVATVTCEIWERYTEADRAEWERGSHVEPSLPAFIRSTLASHSATITREQSEEWWRAAWIPVRDFGVALYPDARDVLATLHHRDIAIALNSTRPCTGEMLQRDIDDFALTPYISAAVCSGDTGLRKPHRLTFDLALAKLGVSATEAVMVGNDAEADMHGAKAIGMTTVWKLNGRRDLPPCRDADYTIDTLAELLNLPLFA